jgi:hypothetical protein
MLLRVRFNRTMIRGESGLVMVDDSLGPMLRRGEIFVPDTLRNQIASVLGLPHAETFPEYLIPCSTLRSRREALGFTQEEVADLARRYHRRLRGTEISGFENGRRYAHPGTRKAIAKGLGIAEPELFPEYQPATEASDTAIA